MFDKPGEAWFDDAHRNEPVPQQKKSVSDAIHAGTVVQDGSVVPRWPAPSAARPLAKNCRWCARRESSKPEIGQLADKNLRRIVPAVVVIA